MQYYKVSGVFMNIYLIWFWMRVWWLIGSDLDPQPIPINISDGLLGYRANEFGLGIRAERALGNVCFMKSMKSLYVLMFPRYFCYSIGSTG